MMIDYNLGDHWSPDDPDWIKSLTSSLDRGHGTSAVLPLTVIVSEIAAWVQLASGPDAWAPRPNRESLQRDLDESTGKVGPSLRTFIAAPLAAFESALSLLVSSPKSILQQSPGTRTDPAWADVSRTAADLLIALRTDEATRACWDDLVAVAQDQTLAGREYRPIAELLFEQIRARGLQASTVFGELVSIVAFGRDVGDVPLGVRDTPLDQRLARARSLVGTAATTEPTVVWLGYKGRIHQHLEAGRVSIYDAHWTVPNAEPGRFEFPHKAELWELVQDRHTFQVAKLVDEESDVDTLVRVDLGVTTPADAIERATEIIAAIWNISIHRTGGILPQLAQHAVLRSGKPASVGHYAVHKTTGFPNDTYGAGITTEAIQRHAPRIAEALAREELPSFLAAAIEVQTTADRPFSRDMALRPPSDADIRAVIPLSDRVVQHVAAHASMGPNDLFDLLGKRWAHVRWLTDLRVASGMCLVGGGHDDALRTELTRELYSTHPTQPWVLLLADRAVDFLSLCRLEHERTWVARMFASISDPVVYRALADTYAVEGEVLQARRRRVRNALEHGNPTNVAVVRSVREYAEFLGSTGLHLALESFVDGTEPAIELARRTGEFTAMASGRDAASYWRDRVATEGWPLPE
ncbi:hypothetical protein [Cellulosimicrobium composti]|uniref:Uncharacterized protein n=1 Tax=Cellulosimicrobium composti TaxID=2672572 RepID=A0ABX0BJ45_9MICO|nr:hypothetical protein [Cellulosimicrobium composti]NDO90801.1 hypothetical protein [Cellulosimicrobium composti]